MQRATRVILKKTKQKWQQQHQKKTLNTSLFATHSFFSLYMKIFLLFLYFMDSYVFAHAECLLFFSVLLFFSMFVAIFKSAPNKLHETLCNSTRRSPTNSGNLKCYIYFENSIGCCLMHGKINGIFQCLMDVDRSVNSSLTSCTCSYSMQLHLSAFFLFIFQPFFLSLISKAVNSLSINTFILFRFMHHMNQC